VAVKIYTFCNEHSSAFLIYETLSLAGLWHAIKLIGFFSFLIGMKKLWTRFVWSKRCWKTEHNKKKEDRNIESETEIKNGRGKNIPERN